MSITHVAERPAPGFLARLRAKLLRLPQKAKAGAAPSLRPEQWAALSPRQIEVMRRRVLRARAW